MLDLICRVIAALLAAMAMTIPDPEPVPAEPTAGDRALVRDFVEFALDPNTATAAKVPFARDGIWIGLGPDLLVRVPVLAVHDPEAWILEPEIFRASSPPFSALARVARRPELSQHPHVSVGPHPHCASPPVPAPDEVADLRRVSFQPADGSIDSCRMWFTVDLYVDAVGQVVAVTLDLWEP